MKGILVGNNRNIMTRELNDELLERPRLFKHPHQLPTMNYEVRTS
jgi:hypothetical protein